MNQKWRILLGICLVVMVCLPVVSAAIPKIPSMNSQNQYGFGGVSIQSKMIQSHRMDSGPSVSDLLHNFGKSDTVDTGLPYTPLDEPIRLKLISYSTTTNHGYYVAIDGYYQKSQDKYIPHVTYSIAY